MADADVLTRLFSDPARAARALHALEESYLFAGTVRPLEEFQHALHTRLALAPSPDRALTQLSRFVEASPSKVTLFDDLTGYPVLLDTLEGLVRFWISDRSGELIPERKFKGKYIRPEWAIRYPSGKILLYEFCTQDNSKRIAVVKSKITRYQAIMREEFVIVFVMDISRQDVIELVAKVHPDGPFMFPDYETFKSVPYGQQFTAPIYIWGEDIQPHPLRNYEHI